MKFLDIEKKLKAKHKEIARIFTSQDKKVTKNSTTWKYHEEGGGVSTELLNGKIIEKAAINFSSITGTILPKSALSKKLRVNKSKFHATGISIVVHPDNPHVPCSHLNVRHFYVNPKIWWFGGGYDLTPYFPFQDDITLWHSNARKMCDKHDKSYYKKFKKQCDEYFYLPHRNERRGVGGIFFDNLNNLSKEKHCNFIIDVLDSYVNSYIQIITRRHKSRFTKSQKDFQLYRRGRYVEFNLLYDRGTTFGLQSGGRAESILMSLPPIVKWSASKSKQFKSFEKNLLKYI